jgi:hypothetical protein
MKKGSKTPAGYLDSALIGARINAEDTAVVQPDFNRQLGCDFSRMLDGRLMIWAVHDICRACDTAITLWEVKSVRWHERSLAS